IRFFRAMPPDRPVAYVVAIRASIEGLALTEKLLAKTTSFTIHSSGLERTLYPRDVLLVPIDGEAWLEHTVQRSRPGPSPQPIDEVLTTVGARYRDRAGAIILSGIGAEGAVGCQAISRFGGQVWTQDSESSEYSSL